MRYIHRFELLKVSRRSLGIKVMKVRSNFFRTLAIQLLAQGVQKTALDVCNTCTTAIRKKKYPVSCIKFYQIKFFIFFIIFYIFFYIFIINLISGWMTVRGKFFMVNGANLACGCARSPMGFSPHCHIGDGCVDVILVRHTSLFNNIRMLLRLSSKQKTLVREIFIYFFSLFPIHFLKFPNFLTFLNPVNK